MTSTETSTTSTATLTANPADIPQLVEQLVEPVANAAGFDVYDVLHHGTTLRVLITGRFGSANPDSASPDTASPVSASPVSASPDTSTLTQISRSLSHQLDEQDLLPGKYTLEVSTPGLERKLTRPSHYVSAIGETVTVKLTEPTAVPTSQIPADQTAAPAPAAATDPATTRRIEGVLLTADQVGITIAPTNTDPTNSEPVAISYTHITTARTVFHWGATKPGKASAKKPSKASAKTPGKPNPKNQDATSSKKGATK